ECLRVQGQQLLEPGLFELVHQRVGSLRGRGCQVQLILEQDNVFDRHLSIGDLNLVIELRSPADRAGRIERGDRDTMVEVLTQPANLAPAAALAGTLPSILAVHVEDQIHGATGADYTAEGDAGEKRLAGAGLAEDP